MNNMAVFKGNKSKKEASYALDDKKRDRLNNDIQSWIVVLSKNIQTAVRNGKNSTYSIISEVRMPPRNPPPTPLRVDCL